MTVAARTSPRKRAAVRAAARRRSAGLVRPPSPQAAVARGAFRDPRSLSRLAFGNHAAADHRQNGGALFRPLPETLAGLYERLRRRRSMTCSSSGPGSAITRARATCMPARARWSNDHGGRFPADEAALAALPGIGRYTAAAIAAIAFGDDGRCRSTAMSNAWWRRIFAVAAELPAAKPELWRLAQTLTPPSRPGDFAQALMDLGATICTPKRPACALCPGWRIVRRARVANRNVFR